jgi:hypothetical protein
MLRYSSSSHTRVNTAASIFFTAAVIHASGFGGLGVCVLASGTQDRGFAPDRSRQIFHNGKIHSTQSFV